VIDNVGATQFPARHTSSRRPAPSPMCGAPRARSKNAVSLIKHRRGVQRPRRRCTVSSVWNCHAANRPPTTHSVGVAWGAVT